MAESLKVRMQISFAKTDRKPAFFSRVIESWHEYTEQRLDLVIRLEDYQQSSVRTKVTEADIESVVQSSFSVEHPDFIISLTK